MQVMHSCSNDPEMCNGAIAIAQLTSVMVGTSKNFQSQTDNKPSQFFLYPCG